MQLKSEVSGVKHVNYSKYSDVLYYLNLGIALSQQKTFKGTFRIKVLAGLVYCFGHIFKPSDDWHEMFSPSITLGLSLSGVPTSDVRLSREEFAILSQLNHRNLVFVPSSSTIPSTYPGSRTPAFGDRRRERAAVEIGLPKEDCTVINEAIKREFRGGSVVAVFLLERNKSPLIPFLLHTQIRNTFEVCLTLLCIL